MGRPGNPKVVRGHRSRPHTIETHSWEDAPHKRGDASHELVLLSGSVRNQENGGAGSESEDVFVPSHAMEHGAQRVDLGESICCVRHTDASTQAAPSPTAEALRRSQEPTKPVSIRDKSGRRSLKMSVANAYR